MLDLTLKALAHGKLSVFLFHKVPGAVDPLVPHDIQLAAFEHLLDTVLSRFQIIPYEDAVACLERGKLPARAACITFDDGYADWLHGIVPALQRRGMHATFFITAGQFEGWPLWHERIAHAIRHSAQPILDLGNPAFPAMRVETLEEKQAAVGRLERDLKYLTLEGRNELLARLEALAGVRIEDVPRMSVTDLKAMHRLGFGIGAHTYEHPILDYCDDALATQEIGVVREILQGLIGVPVSAFAYPNGRPFVDFSGNHVAIVKRAGYTSAVTTQWGVASAGTSVFQIPRFTPWGKDPMRFVLQLGRNLLTSPDRVVESA